MKGSRLKTEKWGSAVTITLTFFFGLLMFSSFGRLGDLLDSLPSSGTPVFSNSDFSAVPPGSDIKDLGWSFVSESEMCENQTTFRNVLKALWLWKWMLTSQYAVLSHSWGKIWKVHLNLAKNPVLIFLKISKLMNTIITLKKILMGSYLSVANKTLCHMAQVCIFPMGS